MGDRFSENWEIVPAIGLSLGAAGSAPINGATLDMLGYSELVVTAGREPPGKTGAPSPASPRYEAITGACN
jgi:hypothetical protein